jgi:hypothetical protein
LQTHAYLWILVTFVYDSFCRQFGLRAAGAERSCRLPLNRDQIALVVLSLAEGRSMTPVKIQKALFLASDKVPGAFAPGSEYHFEPYDYGPFDADVYRDVEGLQGCGFANINQAPGTRWKTYSATAEGRSEAGRLAEQLSSEQREILRRIVSLVCNLTFSQLVSAIYRAYPLMAARSVFRERD